jgi:hypothetical protein
LAKKKTFKIFGAWFEHEINSMVLDLEETDTAMV